MNNNEAINEAINKALAREEKMEKERLRKKNWRSKRSLEKAEADRVKARDSMRKLRRNRMIMQFINCIIEMIFTHTKPAIKRDY